MLDENALAENLRRGRRPKTFLYWIYLPPLYGVVKGSMHVFLLQLEHKSYGAVAIWEAGGGKRVPLCSRPHKLMTSVPC